MFKKEYWNQFKYKKLSLERKQNRVMMIIKFPNTYYVNKDQKCVKCGGSGQKKKAKSVINREEKINHSKVLAAEQKSMAAS